MAYTSYEEYQSYVDSLKGEERESYFRLNEVADDDQLWPDYLDFKEEWQYTYKEQLHAVRRFFIHKYVAEPVTKVECKHHFHHITSEPLGLENEICFKESQTIDYSQCWIRTIFLKFEEVLESDQLFKFGAYDYTMEDWIKTILYFRLLQQDMPHKQLTFEQFKAREGFLREKDNKEALRLELKLVNEKKNHNRKKQVPLELNSTEDEKPEVILPATTIIGDHGLHAVLRVSREPEKVIKEINKIRRLATTDLIVYKDLQTSMSLCEQCDRHIPRRLPPQVIIYAPPGMGKTTALQSESFIGIDTDWLLRNSTYYDMVFPFIDMGLSIITNQYHLFLNGHHKVVGFVDYRKLRLDIYGNPYTTKEEIDELAKHQDFIIMRSSGYLNQWLFMLKFLHAIHDRNLGFFLNRKKVKRKFSLTVPQTLERLAVIRKKT